MSTPKVVEIFNGYRGDVVVCTEAYGVRYSGTASDEAIFSGCIIHNGVETEDHDVYRRQGDQWQMQAPETRSQRVSDELAAHLDLVEQAAATYKSPGRVQRSMIKKQPRVSHSLAAQLFLGPFSLNRASVAVVGNVSTWLACWWFG